MGGQPFGLQAHLPHGTVLLAHPIQEKGVAPMRRSFCLPALCEQRGCIHGSNGALPLAADAVSAAVPCRTCT